jgi:metallo-beta-lactamase family protein
MKLRFVGAATTVTGSQFLLTTDRARVLVDCGMFQGLPSDVERNRTALPYDPASLDAVLLTHAHLDHCGYLPVVVREGFEGPVVLTSATADLALLIMSDSAKIQVERARRHARHKRGSSDGDDARRADEDGGSVDEEARLRAQPPEARLRDDVPLYDLDDVLEVSRRFEPVRYREPRVVAPGVTATFEDAGHILGSAIIVLDVEEHGRSQRLVFSGDLGRPDTPIIEDPTPITGGADFVITETTYGGRHHEPATEAVEQLAAAVRETAQEKGVLLIPSFAVGRTQEIVWHLDRLLSAGEIPHVPLYLDSPMASLASDIYRQHPGYYDEETSRLLDTGETPLDYPGAMVADTIRRSRAIATAPRPMIIVASSGMLTGGRVLNHLAELIDDPAMTLLFVGYQGQGTLGAHIQGGARTVTLEGVEREVRCRIRTLDGFSAHADETELLDWLAHFARAERKPQRVFLVHGDPEASAAIEPKIRALGLETYRPGWREEVALGRSPTAAE